MLSKRMRISLSVIAMAIALASSQLALAVTPTAAEMAEAKRWISAYFPSAQAPKAHPFSFVYDGKNSNDLLANWQFKETLETLDAQRTRRTQTYVDPSTGLTVRCVAVEYADYPTVEWTVYFKNAGTKDTPLLERIEALDASFASSGNGRFVLHHNVGSPAAANDFQPLETPLGPNVSKQLSGTGGRPSHAAWPYFNLECGDQGVIVVVGWPGQWAASFSGKSDAAVQVCAGQETTHFTLHPGEEVRTPLIALQFWRDGDWIRAQNIWRRWMIAHNVPRSQGKIVPAHFGGCCGNPLPSAAEDIAYIDGTLAQGITPYNWILDAGWYPCNNSWTNVGTWEPDPARFPQGMRQLADHLHAKGIQFVVWFEPERVSGGTWLTGNHPEWILGGKQGGILNLGDPDAWKWVVEHVDGLLVSQGIDTYRQDFNIDPLPFWRANDAADRQGITENKYVTGYLAYWDELRRRHPGMWIDSCASGGRRNDLETMRRAVPLLRSDYPVLDFSTANAPGQQGQTYGLSAWLPFYGTGAPLSDPCTMRSAFAPAYRIGWDLKNKNSDFALMRRMVEEFQRVKDYMLGDFYPLTPYSLADNTWMAWQFNRPESGDGMVQAFRHAGSDSESITLKLRGLNPKAVYTIANLDAEGTTEMTGQALMEHGLVVVIKNKPGSAIVTYQAKP